MKNRRNYYRILCVQPDAPTAVIKSSYSALMLKLKQHPDLGGDHETAALINEAYATLTNPERRAEYDRLLQSRQSTATVASGPLHRPTAGRPAETRPASQPPRRAGGYPVISACRFCSAPYQGTPPPGARCAHCDSPLSTPMSARPEGGDPRALPRMAHGGEVAIATRGAAKKTHALIHDLSPTGMCVMAREPIAVDVVIKIDSTLLSAVARVVSCRQEGSSPSHLIGVEFLTLEFATTRGTFVSRRT